MFYLTSEPYSRFYYSKTCSFASFLCLIILAAVVLIPAFVAFATTEVGLRQSVYTEQPNIVFRNEVVLYNFEGSSLLGYSSVPFVNAQITDRIVSPTIKALTVDSNKDGKADTFRFKIGFSSASQDLRLSQIYLFFSYELENTARIEMQDFVKVEISSAAGFEKAKVIGRIDFNQKKTVSTSVVSQSLYNTSIFDDPNTSFNLGDLEQAKQMRDFSISSSYETMIQPVIGTGWTEIDIELIVPGNQIIYYSNTILEDFKFSWIEFCSLFIPTLLIVNVALNYTFRNRLFSIQEINNLGK